MSKAMRTEELLAYLAMLEKDERLSVWHFALLTAILYLGYQQGENPIIKVSRSKIMALSHVGTLLDIPMILTPLRQSKVTPLS